MLKKTIGMKKIILFASVFIGVISYAQIPSYVPSNGLVGWWPFNGNANDESVNGNNGTNNGAIFCNDNMGVLNSALNQSVNGSYIRTQSVINNVYNNFSISFWANPAQADIVKNQGITGQEGPATMSIIHPPHGTTNWGSGSNAGVGINVGTNQIQIVEHTDNYISSPLVYSGQIIGWHHFVLVYNQHIPKLYMDGSIVATGLQSTIQFVRPGSGFCNLYTNSGFGNSFDPNGNPIGNYKGDYDDIGIWNRALTDQEILALYQGCQMVITTQPSNQSVNVSAGNTTFSVASSASNPTYQWQANLGLGFQTLSNAGQYNGVNTANLSVSNLNMSNDNQTFRCIINENGCVDTSDIATLTIIDDASVFEDNATSILISPNPITNQFSISGIEQIVSLTLMDMNGKIVKTLNNKEKSHDVSNLKPGMYFLEARDENRSYIIKVMKD